MTPLKQIAGILLKSVDTNQLFKLDASKQTFFHSSDCPVELSCFFLHSHCTEEFNSE